MQQYKKYVINGFLEIFSFYLMFSADEVLYFTHVNVYIYHITYCSFFQQSLDNMQEEMEHQEKSEGEKGNVEMSSSHPHDQSSSMDQETEDAELVRSIINNHLVSLVLLNTISYKQLNHYVMSCVHMHKIKIKYNESKRSW